MPERMTERPCGICSYCKGVRGTDGCVWADRQRHIAEISALRQSLAEAQLPQNQMASARTYRYQMECKDAEILKLRAALALQDQMLAEKELELAAAERFIAQLRREAAETNAYRQGAESFADWRTARQDFVGELNGKINDLEAKLTAAREENERRGRGSLACSRCDLPVVFEFTVESRQWNRIVRARGIGEYLCFWCFDELAVESNEAVHVGVNINGRAAHSRWCCDDVPGAYPGDTTKAQLQEQLATSESQRKALAGQVERQVNALRCAHGQLLHWKRHSILQPYTREGVALLIDEIESALSETAARKEPNEGGDAK